jgi:hypothetical protein
VVSLRLSTAHPALRSFARAFHAHVPEFSSHLLLFPDVFGRQEFSMLHAQPVRTIWRSQTCPSRLGKNRKL